MFRGALIRRQLPANKVRRPRAGLAFRIKEVLQGLLAERDDS